MDQFGLKFHRDKVEFTVYSENGPVFLLLLRDGKLEEHLMERSGFTWRLSLPLFASQHIVYCYKVSGKKLADPYAKEILDYTFAKAKEPKPFDWEGVQSPKIPKEDLILAEVHVRGFTKHASSGVQAPGTYLGLIEKIPFLKKVGINAVQLLPIFEFDETHGKKAPLVNYWGYNPTHFFAPKKWYALQDPLFEFKTLVKELHRNGIEVILDVVYNHTGEEDEKDYFVNFRGFAPNTYYMIDKEGRYLDFTGCHNTLRANHPIVQQLILDSLTYFASEAKVDGFRFDLTAALTRDSTGKPFLLAPLIEAITKDPLLSQKKLISESWDAADLNRQGDFAKLGWSEWNGRYRDTVRRFIKGTDGESGNFANVLTGSGSLFESPLSSVNFITAHDGFTLKDLVSYQSKHNESNGEGNRDGTNQNESWNCGVEGPTKNPQINQLREQQMRNFLLALFLSQGIPQILIEDLYGHTRKGNNNPYVHDNELNWFLWDEAKKNEKMVRFISSLIAFRKKHKELRSKKMLKDAQIDWNGTDWSPNSRFVSFILENKLFAAFNANYESQEIRLKGRWRKVVLTTEDWLFFEKGELIEHTVLAPYSSILLYSDF